MPLRAGGSRVRWRTVGRVAKTGSGARRGRSGGEGAGLLGSAGKPAQRGHGGQGRTEAEHRGLAITLKVCGERHLAACEWVKRGRSACERERGKEDTCWCVREDEGMEESVGVWEGRWRGGGHMVCERR
eukprot:366072-Chlamydomonas_euryale.AAC.13